MKRVLTPVAEIALGYLVVLIVGLGAYYYFR